MATSFAFFDDHMVDIKDLPENRNCCAPCEKDPVFVGLDNDRVQYRSRRLLLSLQVQVYEKFFLRQPEKEIP